MSKPAWGAGAWAAEAEKEEEEAEKVTTYTVPGKAVVDAFPSLGEANAVKPKKKEKARPVHVSVIQTGIYVGPGGGKRNAPADAGGKLTFDEKKRLPTGPRDHVDEEVDGGLGGGFKAYGGLRGGDRYADREDREKDRGYGRDREMERDDMEGPSRADESADWGAAKKFVPSAGGGGGGDRYGDDRRVSEREGPSRADEVDNWGSGKKFVSTTDRRGTSREDDRRGGRSDERRGGGFDDSSSKADEVDNWAAAKKFVPSSGGRGYDAPSQRDSDGDRWSRREPVREPVRDEARPSERPRLVLQKRSGSTEGSPQSAAASAPSQSGDPAPTTVLGEIAEQPRPKARSNPFGAARPREEILAEKGKDWKQMDSELEAKAARPREEVRSDWKKPDVEVQALRPNEILSAADDNYVLEKEFGDKLDLEQKVDDKEGVEREVEEREASE